MILSVDFHRAALLVRRVCIGRQKLVTIALEKGFKSSPHITLGISTVDMICISFAFLSNYQGLWFIGKLKRLFFVLKADSRFIKHLGHFKQLLGICLCFFFQQMTFGFHSSL